MKRPGMIQVRVVHDNVSNASYPVLVGHYWHDVIVGAEHYLDERLHGRLAALLRMELYPGALNTAVAVVNEVKPGDLSVHPGALIAGLGTVGDLTPGRLTATLAHALTLFGAERVGSERRRRQRGASGQHDGPIVPAPVTAVLVGSGEGGLALGEALQALLRAVVSANERLRRGRPDDAAQEGELVGLIDRLDIIELYEDRAIEATRLLRDAAASPEFSCLEIERLLVTGDEGQRRVRFGYDPGWWQRIRLTADHGGALQFEAVTHTARARATLVATQREVVDRLVERAVTTVSTDAGLGRTLFEMLVPNAFKTYAAERRRLALLMNPEAAALPWELMQARSEEGGAPLSVATGMLRQLLMSDGREQPLRAAARTALVIGNPLVTDTTHPRLERASAEADTVTGLLGAHGYAVRLLKDAEAHTLAVYSAVHERPWRVLHIAAHGVFERQTDPDAPPLTGILLEDAVFTPSDADQMTYVPDLVFINCCYLGDTRADAADSPHRLAANLATQFIRMGARAVVAAGWAVEDEAAHTFATTFYTQMLSGALFGDAILAARHATFTQHPRVNTWGAYQCYGDPSFSLETASRPIAAATFVAPRELLVWLERFQSRARERQGDETGLLEELRGVEREVPPAWWTSADLCASAGAAFAELGDVRRAIHYYTQAADAERAQAPIWALEQLVSCRIRLAGELTGVPGGEDEARRQLQDAETLLTHLLALGRTSERLSLRGALMKRRALLASGDPAARHMALREMSRAYGEAFERSRTPGQPLGLAYPIANQVAAEIVLGWSNGGSPEIETHLAQLQHAADAHAATHTDFFSLAALAECALLRALRTPSLDAATRLAVQERYEAALSRGITTRQLASVRTMLAFFQELIAAEHPDGALAPVAEQLRALEAAVVARA